MAIPWLVAIKAAEALLSGVTARRAAATSAQQLHSAADRLAALEKNDEATAQLLVHLTDQVQSLAQAHEVQGARLHRVTVLTAISLIVALAALVTALAF
jgi:hypothetical protein